MVRMAPSRASDTQAALDAAVEEARAAWPRFTTDVHELREHLAAQMNQGRRLHWADLYLALACAAGEAAAIAAFEENVMSVAGAALTSLKLDAGRVDEVKQMVREKLLVGGAARGPAILDYAGTGTLRSWVKVVAARVGLDLVRRADPEILGHDDLTAALPAVNDDPELALAKRRYAAEFKNAFERAVESLAERDQLVLRQYFVDGLDTRQLAALHRLHPVTAVRWLARVREALATATRNLLIREGRIPATEISSAMRLVRSEMNLSVSRILGGRAASAAHRTP